MSETRLIFLDCELYLSETNTIEFKNYRKNGETTIFQHFRGSFMSKRYLISDLFGQFHIVADSSSTETKFNGWSRKTKINFFSKPIPNFDHK